jgi:hypothetical protein
VGVQRTDNCNDNGNIESLRLRLRSCLRQNGSGFAVGFFRRAEALRFRRVGTSTSRTLAMTRTTATEEQQQLQEQSA